VPDLSKNEVIKLLHGIKLSTRNFVDGEEAANNHIHPERNHSYSNYFSYGDLNLDYDSFNNPINYRFKIKNNPRGVFKFDLSECDEHIELYSNEKICMSDKDGVKIMISQHKGKLPENIRVNNQISYKGSVIYAQDGKLIRVRDKGIYRHQYLGGQATIISSTKPLKYESVVAIMELILRERNRLPWHFVQKYMDRPTIRDKTRIYNRFAEMNKWDDTHPRPNLLKEKGIKHKIDTEEQKRYKKLENYQPIPRNNIWEFLREKKLPSGNECYYQAQAKLTDNKNKNPDERPEHRAVYTPSAGQRRSEKEQLSVARTSKQDYEEFNNIIKKLLKENVETVTLDTTSSEYQVGDHENMVHTFVEAQIEDSKTKVNRNKLKEVRTVTKRQMPSGMPGTTEFNTHYGKEVLKNYGVYEKDSCACFADAQVIPKKLMKEELLQNLTIESYNKPGEVNVNGFTYYLNKKGKLRRTYNRETDFSRKVAIKVPMIMETAKQKNIKIDEYLILKFYKQILKTLKYTGFKICLKLARYIGGKFKELGGLWAKLKLFEPEYILEDLGIT